MAGCFANQVNQVNSPILFYRAEIDGLRAIAVLSVIFYHAQIVLFGRDWFEGGFIGVDIFFVISGYLITRIILSELESKGSFSFLNFYERRARRILPMLFVVIFVSIPFAWQILLPSDFVEYAESILASVFFGSNFFFYFSTTEYGADSALLKPFLHTWSLGVEEQFYLLFPIVAIIAYRYARNHFLTILIGLSLLSLLFSELMEVRNADLNFYLPFSRFWELAVGSLLAYRELYYDTSKDGFAAKILPTLGLSLITYSILFFNATTPHPSFHTLIPIIGVALIIEFASKDEVIGRLLGSKVFVWIGLISYSAYLWHFPIFAFSRMGKDPTNYDKLEWIVLTLILSVLSYFLVEKNFRTRVKNQVVFSSCISGAIIITVAFSIFVVEKNGVYGRYGAITDVSDAYDKAEMFNIYDKDIGAISDKTWEISNRKTRQTLEFSEEITGILIVGNSHAKDLYNVLAQNSSRIGEDYDFVRADLAELGCLDEENKNFKDIQEEFYESSLYESSKIIIISTRVRSETKCLLTDRKVKDSKDIAGIQYLIKNAKEDNKKIILLANKMEFNKINRKHIWDYFEGVFKREYENKETTLNVSKFLDEIKMAYYKNLSSSIDITNKNLEAVAQSNGIPFIHLKPLFCDGREQKCELIGDFGERYYTDGHHLSLKGAKYFGEVLLEDEGFASAIGFDDQ